MRQAPKPRSSNYLGMHQESHINPDGTWIEPEELCYPRGGMTRRAYAVFPDGVKRVAIAGIPDTWFSIPAKVRIKGQTITGYVTGREDEKGNPSYEFRVHTAEQANFSTLTDYKF